MTGAKFIGKRMRSVHAEQETHFADQDELLLACRFAEAADERMRDVGDVEVASLAPDIHRENGGGAENET
eukprot:551460-Hanusia_phi.AAC.1